MDKLNVVILSKEMSLRILVKNKINDENIIIAGYGDFTPAAALKVEGMFPDVVICAVEGEVTEDVFTFVYGMHSQSKGCSVILMTDNVTVDIVNQAAQIGIRQVLPLSAGSDEFCSQIHRVHDFERQLRNELNLGQRVRSKVIGFFSGKGGTGKTTLATNLAVSLAKKNKKVLLIDCDLQFGDVALAMDVEPKDTIVELSQDAEGISIEKANSFSVIHSSGASVICAPKSPEYAEYVTPENIETIIDVVRPYFEYVIVDFAPVLNDIVISGLESCDEIMLVNNVDILSLKNAKVCLNVMEQLNLKDKVKVIINKSTNSLIKSKDYESMLETSIYSTMSFDQKTANSCMNKGQPIVMAMPRTTLGKELTAFAAKVMNDNQQ